MSNDNGARHRQQYSKSIFYNEFLYSEAKKYYKSFANTDFMNTFASERKILTRNVAQLVAHYVRDVGVGRSSRLIPTENKRQ